MIAVSELVRRCWFVIVPLEIGQSAEGAVMPSQNSRRRSTRFGGGLPAMIAALTAPMEMPAIQSGRYSEVESAS
jgi:hypothetical protein